jgi:hypothetical protein
MLLVNQGFTTSKENKKYFCDYVQNIFVSVKKNQVTVLALIL